MYNKDDWNVLSNGHISFVNALRELERLNKKDKENNWRLPTQKELEELPKEAQYMDGLNLNSGLYWTSTTNITDENLQLAGYAGNSAAHYMNAQRINPQHENEEVSLVVLKL